MHFHFTLVCHFYIYIYVYIYSVDNDVLRVSSDSDIEMVDFERRQLKGHKKGRSFGPNLKKMVCQQLINHYWSKYVFITRPSRNAYIFTPVIIHYSLP